MIKLTDILESVRQFSNWRMPSKQDLRREFEVEHEKKGLDLFDNVNEFLIACKNASVIDVTNSIDSHIRGRSRTHSYDDLLDLIKGYRSYPKYRNEKTLVTLYKAFKTNKPMDYPIILELPNKTRQIFSGNTRLDVAFQSGITPKALLVKIDNDGHTVERTIDKT